MPSLKYQKNKLFAELCSTLQFPVQSQGTSQMGVSEGRGLPCARLWFGCVRFLQASLFRGQSKCRGIPNYKCQ